MNLRPHILRRQSISPGYEDADGNYVPGKTEFVGEIPCRAVPNSRASEIAFEDGSTYVYAYTVYVGLGIHEFHAGDMIQVLDKQGRKILEKPIHGNPYIKQLHVKLYI